MDIRVKWKCLNFNFWIADSESTAYMGHRTCFIFFQLQNMTVLELFEVGQIYPFWHFCSKMANILNWNIKFEHVPEKQFSRNLLWNKIIYLKCYDQSFVKIYLGQTLKFQVLMQNFGLFSVKMWKSAKLANFGRL